MARSLLIFAIVVAFASILVSSACIDDSSNKPKNTQQILIDNFTPVSSDELTSRAVSFIGDLEIGSRRSGDSLYEGRHILRNPYNVVQTTEIRFTLSKISHYLKVVSESVAKGAVCSYANTLGTYQGVFSVRTIPNSNTTVHLYIAGH